MDLQLKMALEGARYNAGFAVDEFDSDRMRRAAFRLARLALAPGDGPPGVPRPKKLPTRPVNIGDYNTLENSVDTPPIH